ncbi:hypothetical protein [Tenacibaculum halocynthiae]|uniref:hypothetical protein n=1 Tax=Tenacibaculum halocynthiae TaxID=1254437 RepID=UPI0038B65FFA
MKNRIDFHKLGRASRKTARLSRLWFWKNKKLLHYDRGKGNNLQYHRPWEIGPDGKRRW